MNLVVRIAPPVRVGSACSYERTITRHVLLLLVSLLLVVASGVSARVLVPGEAKPIAQPRISSTDNPSPGHAADPVVGPRACSIAIQGLVGAMGTEPTTRNTYELWGTLQLLDAPATGQLYVRVQGGPSQVFNAPFSANPSIRVRGLYADGASRTVQAHFTAAPGCTSSMTFTAPLGGGTIFAHGTLLPQVSTMSGSLGASPWLGTTMSDFHAGGIAQSGQAYRIPLNVSTPSLSNYTSFCTELGETVGLNATYSNTFTVSALENAVRGVGGTGPAILVPNTGIGRVKAGMVRWLYDHHFATNGNTASSWSNSTSARFQAALWDITHDHYASNNAQSVMGSTPNGVYLTSANGSMQADIQTILTQINNLNWSNAQWESYVSTTWHPILLESLGTPGIQDLIVAVAVTQPSSLGTDSGDLPSGQGANGYATTGGNRARHTINAGDAFLGVYRPDPETAGQPNATATGDNVTGSRIDVVDDEDGVVLITDWMPARNQAQTLGFRVTIGAPGYLSLWVHLNTATTRSLTRATLTQVTGPATVTVPGGANNFGDIHFPQSGVYIVRINAPANSLGNAIATRWRITNQASQGGNVHNGQASTGEVEDYIFSSNQGLPVVLSWVDSRIENGQLRVDWATASEVSNLGFRVLGADHGNRVADGLIVSPTIDSTDPTRYSTLVPWTGGPFYLEDVDFRGKATRHGPFIAGEHQGRQPSVETIDWPQIAAENASSRQSETWNPQSGQAIHLETDAAGVYRLHHADLLANGMDLRGIALSSMALTHRNQPVPFHNDGSETFHASSWIEFYAETSDSLYSAANVYQLHVNRPEDHQRMAIEHATGIPFHSQARHTESAVVGVPRRYSFSSPVADPWYDVQMSVTNAPRSWDFTFPVDHLIHDGERARLQLSAWGVTQWPTVDMDHHLQAFVNLEPVGDVWFHGRELVRMDVSFDSSLLHDGENLLTLTLPADTGVEAEAIAFQNATIHYPRQLLAREGSLAFQSQGATSVLIAGELPATPVVYRRNGDNVARIEARGGFEELFRNGFDSAGTNAPTPTRMALPTGSGTAHFHLSDEIDLPSPRIHIGRAPMDLLHGNADYLVISHPLFIDGLEPLLDFHRNQGRTVRVVDVRDIHHAYSGGLPEGQGIQAFLRDAAGPVGYEYVLLVGGDTYDYKGYLPSGSISYVPTVYAAVDNLVQHMPSDALLVDLDGDELPDRAIGRLTVRTLAELDTVINKTLQYHQRSYRNRALLVADESDVESGLSFSDQGEHLASVLSGDWTLQRSYLDQLPVAQARQTLIDAIDEGQSLVTFIGHSAPDAWTFKGLFRGTDVSLLAPTQRPTVVAQWGCWNTYHVSPIYVTMGHRLTLENDRGAAAVLGSSTFTNSESNAAMGEALIPRLSIPDVSIGRALIDAKRELDPVSARDAILGWTILGDPALRVGD